MQGLPENGLALAALVFAWGLKHGLDADHLVAIDGLARFNHRSRPNLARWCGVLFSLGHGAVILGVAVVVSLAAERWLVPAWVEQASTWFSVVFFLALGLVNLATVLAAPSHRIVAPVGLRASVFGRLTRASSPVAVAIVGALFAISFDTLSQAGLFLIAATQLGGIAHALALGVLFMLGMMLADGANGLWITSLLRRADACARIVSRVLGLAVAVLSLAVAGFTLSAHRSGTVAAWAQGRELALGVGVIAFSAAAFLLGLVLARRSAARNA